MKDRIDKIKNKFYELYGNKADCIVKSPGRVDLMGIHTDYNGGFVLPVAVNVDVISAGSNRNDRTVNLYSMNLDKSASFSLDNIEYDEVNRWSNYIRGVVKYIEETGIKLKGADIVLHGNVPIGSGLSSSAALEISSGYLFQCLNGFDMEGTTLALIGQKAENKFVGVSTGIMDQFISRLGKKDHALFVDCRTMEYELLPLDTSKVKVIVCNTMKQRGLVDSEYDLRRKQCEEAVKYFSKWKNGITQLRDISSDEFEEYKDKLPDVVRKRAEHVIYENERVCASKALLNAGKFEDFAELMNQSHNSARDLYEVSCDELEAMVEATRNAPGSLCGRLAGAGFGGCTVSLVKDEYVEDFLEYTEREYSDKTGLMPILYVCTAEDGASLIS
ncbi:MAG: galactokinase [Armatimonadota bacterium]